MGRPITRKWFGLASSAGSQIVVNGVKFADGTTATNAYIVKQTGSAAYVVQDTAMSHDPEIVFMVNANALSALQPGQCYILATPFGGTALPCEKIAQYRVDLYDTPNTVPHDVGDPAVAGAASYSWSTIPAMMVGQADLITGSGSVGSILSVAINTAGLGYFTAPSITFTGGGTGATAHTTVSNGAVASIVVDTGGINYTSGTVTIGAPTTAATATATATVVAGAVTALTVTLGGGYYTSIPNVTFGGPGTGASATAVLTNGTVSGFTAIVGGTGYTSAPTVTIDPAPASVQATATATISV